MTTTDLHQRFKVEYDKSNVITSYPTLLAEEIDVWLNKANNALISLKFTGNNTRHIAFEGDIKRVSDLLGLVKHFLITTHTTASYVNNAIVFDLSTVADFLFYIVSTIKVDGTITSEVSLISHDFSKKVMETGINKPWIPRPVATINDNNLTVYYDTYTYKDSAKAVLNLVYVKKPAIIDILTKPTAAYELSDNIAYELINLAVFMALENIESQRISTKAETLTIQE